MDTIRCPKCGFTQDHGTECLRCGIVFSRFKPAHAAQGPGPARADKPAPGLLRRLYRVFRWAMLTGAILVLLLILRPAPPPRIGIDAGAAKRVEVKLQEFQSPSPTEHPRQLRLNQGELNAWLSSNLALASAGTEQEAVAAPPPAPDSRQPSIEEVRSTVRDVKVELLDDRLRGYVLFDFHGKDFSLLIEGRLFVDNGYLRLQPISGMLGALPLPKTTLDSAVNRLFDAPDNREKFRVPPQIRDIRVEGSELTVVRR